MIVKGVALVAILTTAPGRALPLSTRVPGHPVNCIHLLKDGSHEYGARLDPLNPGIGRRGFAITGVNKDGTVDVDVSP